MATTRSKGQKSPGSYPSLSGKIETNELSRRLKACGQLLTKADQDLDKSDRRGSELERVARELVSQSILQHNDRTVRLVAACCLSDVLRIFAPEPPYNSTEIQEILDVFVKSLQTLSNQEAKDFSRAYYLLENIAIVKLFLLCTELEDADDLIASVFRLFFSIINDKHSIKIRNFFLDILAGFIVEQETMPQQVLDSILMQLTEEMQSSSAAGSLARDLIRKCVSSLEPYIQQYFNRALLVGKSSESELGDYNIYELIFELNQAAPFVLLSVLPQLEFKLKSTDKDEREEVARLLARMFASPDSVLAEENKPLWRCWLTRFHDISPAIRSICVQFSKYFLVYHSTLARDTEEKLEKAAGDPEETVRSAVIVTLQETAMQDISCLTEKLWMVLQKRLLDKKVSVRQDAMTALATIYNSVHVQCLGKDGAVRENKKQLKALSWIPCKIFQQYYQPSADDSLGVERSLLLHLVPVMADDDQRLLLLFDIYATLDDVGMRAFNEMVKKRERVRRDLVELLAAYKAADKPRCAAQCIQIAKNLPETSKAHDHLKQLVGMLKNRKLYDGLLNCSAIEKGCVFVRNAVLTVLKELEELNVNPAALTTIKALLDRAAPLLVDSGFISSLIRHVASDVDFAMNESDSEAEISEDESDDDDDELLPRAARRTKRTNSDKGVGGQLPLRCRRGLQLIMALSVQYPPLFQMQEVYEQLMSFLKHDSAFVVESSLFILMSVGVELEANYPSIATCLGPVLSQLALKGTPRQAKFSLRCVNKLLGNRDVIVDQILQSYLKELKYDKENLLTIITGLGHVALMAPTLFAPHQKTVIRNFLVKHLLVKDREGRGFREKDPEWSDESRVSRETFLKMASLKLLVRWLSSLPAEEETASCIPVLRLLHCMLQNEGDLNANGKTVAWEKSRLRLAAGCCLLKVSTIDRFAKQVDSDMFVDLALLVQDSCLPVRTSFTNKLVKGLSQMALPVSYLSMFALAAPDPVKDQKNRVRYHLTQSLAARRDLIKTHPSLADKVEVILPEYSVPFLIHLLAHHPDLQENKPESLAQLKEYLWFFLEPPMLRGDTYSFLKKMVETIKQTRDATAPSDPKENEAAQRRLYVVCDVALGLMANRLTHFTSEPFPGRIVVPRRIFESVPKDAPLNTTKYIPPSFSFSPVSKQKKLTDRGPTPLKTTTTTVPRSQSKDSIKSTQTTKSKSESVPTPSSRPSRSAKAGANAQLSSTKHSGDEDNDDSGNESDEGPVQAADDFSLDGIEEFSSAAEPSSESQESKKSPDNKSTSAPSGRGKSLKQTTLTGSVLGKQAAGSRRGGRAARGSKTQDSTDSRVRSPIRQTKRATPVKSSSQSSSQSPVIVSPVASENAATMERLNAPFDSDDDLSTTPKQDNKALSGNTAPSRAKRSLSSQLDAMSDSDEADSGASGAAKKPRRGGPPQSKKQASTAEDSAKASQSPRKGQATQETETAKTAAAAATTEETDSGVRVPNVKRSSARRR